LAAAHNIISLSRVKNRTVFGDIASVLFARRSVLSARFLVLPAANPLRLAGQITIRACIIIRINMHSLDAFGTSPPAETKIFATRSQKFFDRFRLFLAIFVFARLWLASFDKILRVVFSIVLSTMIFSERSCVTTLFVIAIHKYLFALFFVALFFIDSFFVALFFSVLFFADLFFGGLMNCYKMAF
jgi:hypothetical protein